MQPTGTTLSSRPSVSLAQFRRACSSERSLDAGGVWVFLPSSQAPSCSSSLLANAMYAIMYAYTPESFPGPHRGLGTGQAATNLRFGSLVASLIGTYTGFSVVPIYVSAALWIFVGAITFGLPFETAGHSAV
jgi:hypothetical protein